MQLANKDSVCNKCNSEIKARVHYCAWSRKDTGKIWHINCNNPALTGYDSVLLQRPSTFFTIYAFECRICHINVIAGELASVREGLNCHSDCKNPSGLQAGSITTVDPIEPNKPTCPICGCSVSSHGKNPCILNSGNYCNCSICLDPSITLIKPEPQCSQCGNLQYHNGLCKPCYDKGLQPTKPEPWPVVQLKPEPKPVLNAGSDGLLNLIVDSVAKELSTKVADAINSVKDTSKAVTDRLEKELSDRLKDIVIPVIEIKRPELPSIKIDNVHKQFKETLELLNSGENVYLWGAPGAGKTHLGPQLAEALGVPYYCVSLSEQSPEYKITGFTSPVTCQFVSSPFINFYDENNEGGLYHFSELDLANDNFRASLNSALENGTFSTDKGMIKRHSKFYCIGDGNTAGRGAHPAFPSRIAFDAAFAARFYFIEFEYDWQLAKNLVKQINEDALCLVDWFRAASPWAIANGIPVVLSPRELLKLAKLTKTTSLKLEKLFEGMLRGLDIISKEKLLQNFPLPPF